MRWARSDRRPRAARPGARVVALAGLAGVAVGLGIGAWLPDALPTTARYVDEVTVVGGVDVRPCSHAWSAAVAALGPVRHHDFAADAPLPGDPSTPGLVVCDPSGALALAGGFEQAVTDPAGPVADADLGSVVLWAAIGDAATPGDLLRLARPDGSALVLRVGGGRLLLAETPSGGGPAAVLADVPAPDAGPHLLALTRPAAGDVRLWVDATAAATATVPTPPGATFELWLGAPPGSGTAAARAVLDEVVVLPAALGQPDLAALVAANAW